MKSWIPACLLFAATLPTLTAAENDGLSVDVQKISLQRNDGGRAGHMTVDRKMTLKINIQNNSMKELTDTAVNYVIVVERWGMETNHYERITGQVKVDKLAPSLSETVNGGDIHIGGHYHGTSDRHVDHIAGWKMTIPRDGKNLEFLSSPNFDALNARVDR
jgi:hypothetical protein